MGEEHQNGLAARQHHRQQPNLLAEPRTGPEDKPRLRAACLTVNGWVPVTKSRVPQSAVSWVARNSKLGLVQRKIEDDEITHKIIVVSQPLRGRSMIRYQ